MPKHKYRGSYYGFSGGHIEYHTVNQKREKPADCIYMTNERICQNKESPEFLRKCFVSSICKYRARETIKVNADTKKNIERIASQSVRKESLKREKIVSINCSLREGCPIHSRIYGQGKLVGYNSQKMIMEVEFDGKVRPFQYPDAILGKYLTVSDDIYEKVVLDKKHAKIEWV